MASAPDQHPLVRKLESIADLAPEERQAVLDLPMRVQPIEADQDIVREGDRPWAASVQEEAPKKGSTALMGFSGAAIT